MKPQRADCDVPSVELVNFVSTLPISYVIIMYMQMKSVRALPLGAVDELRDFGLRSAESSGRLSLLDLNWRSILKIGV